MKLKNFLRFFFISPLLLSNIHFLSKRIVFECIENIEITSDYFQELKNYSTFFKEFYSMNFIIIYNFNELILKLQNEFHYYFFSNIFEKIGNFIMYELFFYKKECNENFIKYLYFIFWFGFEMLFVFSPDINLFSILHYRYRLVFFSILAFFYFSSTI